MTIQEREAAARQWCDYASDIPNCRFLHLVDGAVGPDGLRLYGFRYDGEGFFAPQFKGWDDHYSEYWEELARRRMSRGPKLADDYRSEDDEP